MYKRQGYASYRSEIDGVLCRISYIKDHGQPALRVKLTNNSPVPYQPCLLYTSELDMWHCTYLESVYSDRRTGSHCRTIGSKKVYSRECRYLENGYCDFCSNDFCRHFHCCSFVFLPCTCVEYNRRTFKFIRIAG